MTIEELIKSLADPLVYPDGKVEDRIHVLQTHISAIFLTSSHAYKLKKPVHFEFLDFRDLEQREFDCHEEVRLNRRLAPDVYQDVVAVIKKHGRVQVQRGVQYPPDAILIDWLVRMERLPDNAQFARLAANGLLDHKIFSELACRLARFHNAARSGPAISNAARFDPTLTLITNNLEESATLVGRTIHPNVHNRLSCLFSMHADRLRPLINERADYGRPREGHGDIRLDHIYWRPDQSAPHDLVVIDCIEFSEQMRYMDPVADIAFLVMDLLAAGHRDFARLFARDYLSASADPQGRSLLPFYVAYRAAVRAKVEGLKLAQNSIHDAERSKLWESARGHWLLALESLESQDQRPLLLMVGGLPGTGKSTLAAELAQVGNFTVIRTDVVRKQIYNHSNWNSSKDALSSEMYSDHWTKQTYLECLRQADAALFEGQRVLVDASFCSNENRLRFLHLGRRWCIPVFFLECRVDPEIAHRRINARHADASDADIDIAVQMASRWEELSPEIRLIHHVMEMNSSADRIALQLVQWLDHALEVFADSPVG